MYTAIYSAVTRKLSTAAHMANTAPAPVKLYRTSYMSRYVYPFARYLWTKILQIAASIKETVMRIAFSPAVFMRISFSDMPRLR